MMKIGAAILAGGKASRLNGISKGLLRLANHQTIIEYLISVFKEAAIDEILIVTDRFNDYAFCNRLMVRDLRVGCGPLAGIEAALDYYQNKVDAVLFLPCDMPYMNMEVISRLINANFHSDIVFCALKNEHEAHMQPLCARVNTQILPKISDALDKKNYKIRNVWQALHAMPILCSDPQAFININKPKDLREASIVASNERKEQ